MKLFLGRVPPSTSVQTVGLGTPELFASTVNDVIMRHPPILESWNPEKWIPNFSRYLPTGTSRTYFRDIVAILNHFSPHFDHPPLPWIDQFAEFGRAPAQPKSLTSQQLQVDNITSA
jgi:hypothetical protein